MTPTLQRMRWWHIAAIRPLERDLFGVDCWSDELFWSELAQGDSRHYVVATVDGTAEVLGYAGLCANSGEAFVQTIAVRRDVQGHAIGSGLLLALLREAVRRGADTIGLEVRADNDRARALYRRFGFVEVGLRRGYYQLSNTDAVVMTMYRLAERLRGLGDCG